MLLVVSTIGAALIAFGASTGEAGSKASVSGDLLVAVSLLGGVAWILLSQRLMKTGRYTSVTASAYVMTLGGLMVAAWVIPMDQEFAETVRQVLDVQQYPDLRESPDGPLEQPYDAAGWVAVDQAAELFARGKAFDKSTAPDYAGFEIYDYALVTKDNLPPEGEYRTPKNDFVTFFKTKWQHEFGTAGR